MSLIKIVAAAFLVCACSSHSQKDIRQGGQSQESTTLAIQYNEATGVMAIFRDKDQQPILTQQAQPDIRPYIHPIIAPDGKGILTQFSPDHHKHQTGLYWGLKRVNERDYFMNWQADYWHKVSARVVQAEGNQVKWQTIYDLLDENKQPLLTETQSWTMQVQDGRYLLDLVWKGEAKKEVVIGKFYVGGLFLRMPWHTGVNGRVINAAGQLNQEGEGQRAIWADIGIQVEGRHDLAHIALFDHPDNPAFPTPWRIDNELGIGPSRQILGDWSLSQGEVAQFRYRLLVYTGELPQQELTRQWKHYICEPTE